MNTRCAFLLSCFFLMALAVGAHTNIQHKKIEQVIVRFFDGLSALDGNKIRAEVTDSFVLLENGAVWNVDSLVKVLEPLKKGMFSRSNQFKFFKTSNQGNTAWTSYENTAEMKINGKDRKVRWLESAVLVKKQNAWKIDLLHSTVLK